MPPVYEARCAEHKARNGRHYLSFSLVDPGELPGEFSLKPSPTEYERLAEQASPFVVPTSGQILTPTHIFTQNDCVNITADGATPP